MRGVSEALRTFKGMCIAALPCTTVRLGNLEKRLPSGQINGREIVTKISVDI